MELVLSADVLLPDVPDATANLSIWGWGPSWASLVTVTFGCGLNENEQIKLGRVRGALGGRSV